MRSMFFVGGPAMSIGSSAKYTSPLGAKHSAVGASMSGACSTSSTLKPAGAFGTCWATATTGSARSARHEQRNMSEVLQREAGGAVSVSLPHDMGQWARPLEELDEKTNW